MRLADVTGGQLLVNDVNVTDYDPVTLRQHIAVLFQDIGQYRGLTILENIGIGKVGDLNSSDAIRKSATDAGAAEFIDQLPHKYDSYLGFCPNTWGARDYRSMKGRWDDSDSSSSDEDEERKNEKAKVQSNLSGGQWQKIALARAFMRGNNADLLVLDEPTANLDPEAEYNLFESIRKFRKGLTTIYISHRFNTVRAADRIMVLKMGELKEFGTHEELMALQGEYHRLYSLQAKGFQLDNRGGVSLDIDGVLLNVNEAVAGSVQ
jgi:ATP-binding cassette, subfamily B, bacterial